MKRFLMAFATLAIALFCMPCFGQDAAKNDQADNIIGKYEAVKNGNPYRVQISKNADGTYKAQIYWLSNPIDPETGKPSLDKKNPDKSLRNTPSDQVVLIRDLKYKAAKKQWGDAKIYDPSRGIRANVTAWFAEDGRLCLKGTVLGIGEKVYWTPVTE